MRKSKLLLFFFLILLAFAIFLILFLNKKENHYSRVYFPGQNILLNVRLAETPSEWSRGLMFEKSLAENKGMLFVFPDEMPRQFWMKNMNFPLDIIFISSDKTIVEVKENFAPCASEDCLPYQSPKLAKYVLEVNADFVKKYGLKTGDLIDFRNF